ncbi:response regulator [Stackebrandtia nassauensis]|uniref:Two component transcriptional regulator, LuxR family n=1 Tax=Stackebrandtia nassauensis (strain DSM 44728 / CIP 108903 / NRRL B-16338 / NBRC 102104 / LLR-40K-21) TaxID=446470 RepID=D3Q684_STANL|nr:response regulator transcription factor [Stackebrandtia nassauensis]ADD42259.1 two component transcriptional regulator, LuxR family [Stackebrandtia nassauensis DSM 44728]
MTIALLIVDDHPVVRDGLRGMLSTQSDFTVVGEAAGGEEALAMLSDHDVDVMLTDLRMPAPSGAALIRLIAKRHPRVRVLVLTTYDTDADVLPAMEAGAVGYLLKDTPRQDLYRAVRSAADGETALSPSVAARLVDRLRSPGPARSSALSAREIEVLSLVAAGNSNKAIAAALFISEATVKTHLLHIYGKLGVNDRAAAVAAGYDSGLLGPSS